MYKRFLSNASEMDFPASAIDSSNTSCCAAAFAAAALAEWIRRFPSAELKPSDRLLTAPRKPVFGWLVKFEMTR